MRNVWLYSIAVVICLSCALASAQEPISTPILTTAPNFRDLAGISASNGGTGFANMTSNNGVMRTGIFYRTDVLALNSLSIADWTTVSAFHIGRDIDLRTPSEYLSNPDWPPNGAIYTNINIYGIPTLVPLPPITAAPSAAISAMQGIITICYRSGSAREFSHGLNYPGQ